MVTYAPARGLGHTWKKVAAPSSGAVVMLPHSTAGEAFWPGAVPTQISCGEKSRSFDPVVPRVTLTMVTPAVDASSMESQAFFLLLEAVWHIPAPFPMVRPSMQFAAPYLP